MKNLWKYVFVTLFVAGVVNAGAIKLWSNGDALNATDLNSNFNHIHNLMVGGHGARLVDADVSASANIKLSKLESSAGIASGMGFVSAPAGTPCIADPCTVTDGLGIAAVNWGPAGNYVVTAAPGAFSGDSQFIVSVESRTVGTYCYSQSTGINTFAVFCNTFGGIATDVTFDVIFWDRS